MKRMLDPTSIVLIGATDTEGTVGRTIMENLMRSTGRDLYPVNPHHDAVLGVSCYPGIGDVPVQADLVVVATPAASVPEVIAECARAQAGGAIVVSAGFGETGTLGQGLEQEIKDALQGSPMRVVGPNCLGIIRPPVGLNASILTVEPERGNIALISQSAALGTGMLDWAVSSRIGFSLFASVGSMVDVDFADLVDFLGEDPNTRSILVYMEDIGSARRFMSAARAFARNKPIIVLKPGRFAESAAAALSHTGSMTGGDEIYEAAFRRVGVVRVHEVAGLFRAAEVLDSRRLPVGRDVAVVTNAGGLGVMATDSIIEHGGRLAKLPDTMLEALDAALPAYWSHANPIDVLGDAGSERFAVAVKACLEEPGIHGILLIYTPQGNARPDEMAEKIAALAKGSQKPIIAALVGGETVEDGRRILQDAGIPCYETPEYAVKTYLGMYDYSRNLELLYETPGELPIDVAPAKHNLNALLRRVAATGRLVLTEEESKHFVTTYGMPIVRQSTAHSVEEALSAAADLGYPVVLKVVSHAITHKSAVGGVEVGVCSPDDLEGAYERVMTRVKASEPEAEIEGIAVQKMVRDIDYELMLGMKKDCQFGSVLLFGAGGVGAEGLADFSVSLPPLNQVLARRMMEGTRIFKTMRTSPRGVPQPDFCELEELLTMLSNMVVDFPEIAEIDINPLVISRGKALVVDARVVIDESVLRGQPDAPHLVITPYPTRYVSPWRLSDGTEALLRPIRPEDEPMLGEMLATISAQSLRFRFFGNVPSFDHDRLVRFTNNDYDREIAIIAEVMEGPKKRIAGVARLMGDPERGAGEFATLIHDDFQGKGLGFKLIDVIIGIAHEKGFHEITGFVASDNQRMLRVVEQLGFRRIGTEECVTEIRLDLG